MIYQICILLFVHWFADFIAQSDRMAAGKSKDFAPLICHTCVYVLCFIIPLAIMLPAKQGVLFIGITLLVHTVQDYLTSRLNSRLWAAERRHDFFIAVGFDQLLHAIQLILTLRLVSTL